MQVTIRPAIEQGFYYDFDRDEAFSDEDLLKIEERMKELGAQKLPYSRRELTKDEAIKTFREMGEHYKVEILEEIPDGDVISTPPIRNSKHIWNSSKKPQSVTIANWAEI